MAKDILFRPADDESDLWLRQNAKANNRPISEELRAASAVYRELVELAHTRALKPAKGQEQRMVDLQRRLKDGIGRVLLPAITEAARSKFENDLVDYPEGRFGQITMPFDALLDWIVNGDD